MVRGRTVAALLALAVALAGCGAPVAQSPVSSPKAPDGTPTPNPANETGSERAVDREPITVTNGSLSVDPNVVFDRVQALQGSNVARPSVVQVFNSVGAFENQSAGLGAGPSREFYTLAGMTDGEVNVTESVTRQKNGYVTGLGSIVLYVGENASRVDELLLSAHEFTHYVQLQSGRQEQLARNLGGIGLTDRRYVLRAILEGGAVVTTDTYLATYANTSETNTAMYTTLQSSLPPGHIARYGNGKYVEGIEYVASRSETPADLAAVYERPPTTSEQLLHRLAPGEEPPTPLDVRVETGEAWVPAGTDRMGEAFVRTALESTLDEERAAAAATGWGNDTLRLLRPADGDGDTAYAWVLGWDDAANQTEFRTAYRASLDERGTETRGVWTLTDSDISATLTEPTPRTSVVVFGPESLVRNVSTTGQRDTVTVSTP